ALALALDARSALARTVIERPALVVAPTFYKRVDVTSPAVHVTGDWSAPERDFRWTRGREATVDLDLPPLDPRIDTLVVAVLLSPFLAPGRPSQRVGVALDGRTFATFVARNAAPATFAFTVPRKDLGRTLRFTLPDAVSPKSLGVGQDERALGVAVYAV